jgi:hypothetical protein
MIRPSSKPFNRREFLGAAAAALFAGIAVQIYGCADSNPSGMGPGDLSGDVSENHGHRAVITKAQLDAGLGATLNIQGDAPHTHTVEITGTEMAAIQAGMRVAKTSSAGDGHTHLVTFN